MWKQKIGISVGNHYTLPTKEIIALVGKIGFDAVSPEWEEGTDLEELVTAARENGLELQSLHAPFASAADIWSSEPSVSKPALNKLLCSARDCARFEIPILTVHAWIGFDYSFKPDKLFFGNWDKLVAEAEALGIKIAFENTEGEEYLFALMRRYADNTAVGFCWDSGHEMCYNHSRDLLNDFGDRLLLTHLNDNLGISRFDGKTFWTDDLHLLPFDGIADWDYNIKRLKSASRLEILNFELNIASKPDRHENDAYALMSPELYFTEAYKRACKAAFKYAE